MTDPDKILSMLKSPKADTRYDACEELRLALQSSPEAIMALKEAAQDEEEYVAESARLALGAEVHQKMARKMEMGLPIEEKLVMRGRPLMDELDPDDTAYAVGKVRRRFDQFFGDPGSTGLLVRSSGGSYYVVDEDEPGKTEIHSLIDKPILRNVGQYSSAYVAYIGLVSNSGVIGFMPFDLYPEKIPDALLVQKVSADFVLSRLKELEELAILQQCPICQLIRPVDVPQCSNPECAVELVKIGESHNQAAAARAGCIIGGGGGVLVGLILIGIVEAVAWKLNAPEGLRIQIRLYGWVLPAILGLVGTFGLQYVLGRAIRPE